METIAIIIMAISLVITAGLAIAVLQLSRKGTAAADTGVAGKLDKMSTDLATERGGVNQQMNEFNTKLANLQQTVDEKQGALATKLGDLDTAMNGVAKLFDSNQQRGSWGELSLQRTFELAGMAEGRDFDLQFHAGDKRPDAVVHLPHERTIVIDSKFPTARFVEAMNTTDDDERCKLLEAHGKEVLQTGKALAKKHYTDEATADYVVMYVPSQAVYEAALDYHRAALEALLENKVIVAGPTAVFGIVMTAGSLLAESKRLEDAEEILEQVVTVRDRLAVFTDHLGGVGTALCKASENYNKAVASWDKRLRPAIDKATDMARLEDVEGPEPVEELITNTEPQALKEAS